MFDDQQIDLLPERTTMQLTLPTINVAVATGGISIPVNAGNINFGGTQVNTALAWATGGVAKNITLFQ